MSLAFRAVEQSPPRTFIPEVESLRGLAALAVVGEHSFHILDRLGGTRPGLFDTYHGVQPILHWLIHAVFNGRAGVILFFAISGLVLGIQLDRTPGSAPARLASYGVRRFFRIMPTMWVAAFVAWPVALWWGHPENPDLTLVVKTMFFQDTTLNQPLWTLYVEMVCSTAFPIIYFLSRRLGLTGNLLCVTALASVIYYNLPVNALAYLVYFDVGLLVGAYGQAVMSWLGVRASAFAFCAAVLVYAFSSQLWPFGFAAFPYDAMTYPLLMQIPACFIILAYVTTEDVNGAKKFLRLPAIRFLGRISFSLYLFHFLVINALYNSFYSRINAAFYDRWPVVVQTGFFLVCATVSLVIASLAYRLVERPTTRWGRGISDWILALDVQRRARPAVTLP